MRLLETGMIGLDQPWLLLFAFVIGHALADFPLQGEFLAMRKNHRIPLPKGDPSPRTLWIYCLSAHCFIHAGFVWIISGLAVLAIAEFVAHWLIDFAKSEGWTNFHVDQGLHIVCKGAFVVLIQQGIVGS